jgi:hypothetical protein
MQNLEPLKDDLTRRQRQRRPLCMQPDKKLKLQNAVSCYMKEHPVCAHANLGPWTLEPPRRAPSGRLDRHAGRHDLGSTRSCTASGQVGRGSRLTGRNDPVPFTSRRPSFLAKRPGGFGGKAAAANCTPSAPRRKLVWSGFKTLYSVPKLHSSCNTSHHTPRSCGARFFLLQRRSTCPRIASS